MIVVGNKVDKEVSRDISKEHVERIARDSWSVPHIQTSAKENFNISEMFARVLRLIKNHHDVAVNERRKRMKSRGRGCCVLL